MLFCSRFNTVDIHKINLLSKEINPMLRSHGNTSRAAQFFSLWILWEAILPGPAASLAAQSGGPRNGTAGRVGGGAARIEECGSGIRAAEKSLLPPSPCPAPSWVFLESCGRPWIQMRSPLPAGPGRLSPGPGYPLWEASQKLCLAKRRAQTQRRLCPISRAPGPG